MDRIVIVDISTVDPITESSILEKKHDCWTYDIDMDFDEMTKKSFLQINPKIRENVDTVILSSLHNDPYAKDLLAKQFPRIRPSTFLKSIGATATVNLFGDHKKNLDVFSVGAMCATGLKAMEIGYMLAMAKNSVVMIGCTDRQTTPVDLKCFASIRALSTAEEFRGPFDVQRRGFAMGAASAWAAVCTEKKAKEMNIEPIAIIESIESQSRASHTTSPSDGIFIYDLVQRNVKDINSIAHWNAHATCTEVGDVIEHEIFKMIVRNRDIPISSLKGRVGHTMSASAIVELYHGIKSIQNKRVFANENTVKAFDPDPRIITEETSTDKDTFIKASFGFGGKNSIAVVKVI